jgi:GTP-binding protein
MSQRAAPSTRGLLLSEYVTSLVRADDPIPGPALPEIALAGRSNVGKSSLLNLLVGRRALARVSRTPGRTRMLNVFRWGAGCYLVDVPGYGWSRAGRSERQAWRRLVERYVAERSTLAAVLWLLDLRREPSPDDGAFARLLAARRVPVLPVATKADKVARGQRTSRIAAIAAALALPPSDVIVTSARTREGQEALREAVLAFAG